MLLAEALAERRQILDRIGGAGDRWVAIATWDEDEPAPAPSGADAALGELDADLNRLQQLNVDIYRANNQATVDWGGTSISIMETIALRDRLNLERSTLEEAKKKLEDAIGARRGRWFSDRRSRDDVKTSSLIDPRDLGRRIDALAARMRELDLEIQKVNWSHQLSD